MHGEDDEDVEEEEEDEDEEYGEDFNDNFVVDYGNVDRRTLIKELVNASNALDSVNDQSNGSNNTNSNNTNNNNNNKKQSSENTGLDSDYNVTSNLNDSGRDAIYKDLMSTISAAAAAISGRLQNQISTVSSSSSSANIPPKPADNTASNNNSKSIKDSIKNQLNKPNKSKSETLTESNVDQEDQNLNSKLCTFTVTKKEFMNQHWYYCHTCKMVDRIGMCTICAKVCHNGHDVSYAKYGSFFCDCGAKEDGSCLALTKRPLSGNQKKTNENIKEKKPKIFSKPIKKKHDTSNNSFSKNDLVQQQQQQSTNLVSQVSKNEIKNSTLNTVDLLKKIQQQLKSNKPKQLEKLRNQLIDCLKTKDLLIIIRRLLDTSLLPLAQKTYDDSLLNTNSLLSRKELAKFKGIDYEIQQQQSEDETTKQIEFRNVLIEQQQLFIVTLGSQEGAFENVRMTYASDHGPLIKQLIQTHSLRRTSMCCLATKSKKHLIVTHEKGKSSNFTILQLNALLKQDSNKKNKLTLTKLNTVPVPFTLLSVVANHCNEDYIALNGLKDCYIMYLSENGQTKQELLIQQQNITNPPSTLTTTTTTSTGTNTAPSATTTAATTTTAAAAVSTSTNTETNQNGKNSKTLTSSHLPSLSTNSAGLIVLHPSLESSNYIIKSIWLPGSQTELALVTSEFIKIYDLSIDKISPIYYYLLPIGKIKDVTFVYDLKCENNNNNSNIDDDINTEYKNYKHLKYIIIMSSCGYLYYEEMNQVTSAKNGVYYITNTIEFQPNESSSSSSSVVTNSSTCVPKSPKSTENNVVATNVLGGGISVYYSFKLGLLFWSYQQGKTYIGSFRSHSLVLDKVFPLSNNNNKTNNNFLASFQALCNWSEIPSHPGLVMAMTLLSNNPVVLMILPDKIYIQEIKLLNNQGGPSKAKIQDMVATRHPSASSLKSIVTNFPSESSTNSLSIDSRKNQVQEDTDDSLQTNDESHNKSGIPALSSEKTTMIILCDDGSLKIYVADSEKTEYWLQPHLKSTNPLIQLKSTSIWSASSLFELCPMSIFESVKTNNVNSNQQQQDLSNVQSESTIPKNNTTNLLKQPKIKRESKSVNLQAEKQKIGGPFNFPIDFFEKCTQLNDVEYGGNDLLEVYNIQQLKSRLNGGSKFVASMKSSGFKLEIMNKNDSENSLLVGCRILCGTHSIERVPLYFQVFDRRITVNKCTRQRWFDICLTREEAFIADNKLTVLVGCSADARHITVIDACVSFVKTKELLNWSKTEAQSLQKRYQQQIKTNENNYNLFGFNLSKSKMIENFDNSTKKLNSINKKKTKSNLSSVISNNKSYLLDYKISLFDQLLGQSLDILENCIILNDDQSQIENIKSKHYNISLELLSLICPPLISYKAKSLLFNILSLPLNNTSQSSSSSSSSNTNITTLYNNYIDDALLNLLYKTFYIKNTINDTIIINNNDYFDFLYDLETLEKTLLVCKSLIQQQRGNNLIKYLNDKFNIASNGQKSFISALNSLFWRIIDRSFLQLNKNRVLGHIGCPKIKNLNLIIENLIEIMHTYLIVEYSNIDNLEQSKEQFSNSKLLNQIVDSYMRLLCSNELEINFTARKCILQLLKPSKKAISSSSNSSIAVVTGSTLSTSTTKQNISNNQTKIKSNIPSLPPPPPPNQIPAVLDENLIESTIRNDSNARFPVINNDAMDVDNNNQYLNFEANNTNDTSRNEIIEDQEQEDEDLEIERPDENVNNTQSVAVNNNNNNNAPEGNAINPNNNINDFQFFALAPYVFNEDDEMLQLAMALSLNEPQFQQNNQGMLPPPPLPPTSQQQLQPPAPMPRSTLNINNSSTNLTESINQPAKRSSSKLKRKPLSGNKDETTELDVSPKQPVSITESIAPVSYLLNSNNKLIQLRKILLEKFSQNIDIKILESYFNHSYSISLINNSGINAIAFFQCIITLMTDLNPKEENDKKILDNLIQSFLNILKPLKNLSNKLNQVNSASSTSSSSISSSSNETHIYTRTEDHEIQLLVLRTISILLSKSKYQRSGDNCNFIIQTLLSHLSQFNIIEVCLNLMKLMYFEYWKKMPVPAATDSILDSLNENQSSSNAFYASSNDRFNNNGLMKFSNESSYYEELSPYFVHDPLNKDSFVIPAPILTSNDYLATSQTKTTTTNNTTPNITGSSINLFDNYSELLTEILIRLPYQMKKLCLGSSSSSSNSSATTSNATATNTDQATIQYQHNLSQIATMFEFSSWTHYLCEFLLLPQCQYLKRLIKKLLQILCGSKDKYRKFKDQHILTTCIKNVADLSPLNSSPAPFSMLGMGSTINQASESLLIVNELNQQNIFKQNQMSIPQIKLTYLSLLKIIDNLKIILEVAVARTVNWQRFCTQNPSTLLYLIDLALLMGVDSNGSGCDSSSLSGCGSAAAASTPVIIPTLLQLLLCSLGTTKSSSKTLQPAINLAKSSQGLTNTLTSQKSSKKSSTTSKSSISDENLCSNLVNSLFKYVSKDTLYKFIRTYLLEAAQPNIRWTLHSLLYSVFKNSNSSNQEQLYEILIQLWPDAMTAYGSKASQYVDLVGYIIIKFSSNIENQKPKEFLQKIIELFQSQNLLLATHPNSTIYNTLENLLNDFEGLYLEPDPCFICNNIELPIVSFKLNTVKADSRFTTNQQIFKLTNSHSISKILIKITEIRKSKMVSAINVYYTNKSTQSIVDLKMNSKLWLKAKRVTIQPTQQEVKIEFQLPIIACNLMIEYADFYDRDAQTHTETTILQCPRCSASVPAHPGVCNTCGENVFQCHKCRSINYDERDPFLCNSCGFCKFAKFDFTLVGRNCCAVDPIESEEDRKQTLQTISSLLDRADKIYFTLSQHTKPTLEALIIKMNEQNVLEKFQVPSITMGTNNNSSVDQQINLIPNSTSNQNGIIGIKVTSINNNNNNNNTGSFTSASSLNSNTNFSNKTIQSIVQKYSIECKSKFDELSKIILKLNLCRKELREYDRQFKTFNNSTNIQTNCSSTCTSSSITRKNSIAYDVFTNNSNLTSSSSSANILIWNQNYRNKCYGCASASIEHCINLLRALICSNNNNNLIQSSPFYSSTSSNKTVNNSFSNYVKSELCRNGILEELINFNLKRNLLFYNTSLLNNSSNQTTNAPNSTTTSNTNSTTTNNTTSTTTNATNNSTTGAPAGLIPTPSTTGQIGISLEQTTKQTTNTLPNLRLYHRDIVNLIYLLIKDNVNGTERFQKIITEKIEAFLTSIPFVSLNNNDELLQNVSTISCLSVSSSLYQISGGNAFNSPLKHEMMLLTSLMQKPQDDICWEMRIRLVIHLLLRSLNAASLQQNNNNNNNNSNKSKQYLNNPIIIECLTLPCLRILNHICKTSTNISLLNSLTSNANNNKPIIPAANTNIGATNTTSNNKLSNLSNNNQTPLIRPSLFSPPTNVTNLNRYYSEPADVNYTQSQQNLYNQNFMSNTPGLSELDPNEFLQQKNNSFYEKWLNLNNKNLIKFKSEDTSVSPQIIQIKSKYFAAWRKYTLKKRKQQQQQSGLNSALTNDSKLSLESSLGQSSTNNIAKINLKELNQYDYDLKLRWLKQCLFCPSSKSVRQLTCNLLQNIFNFYSNTSFLNNPLNSNVQDLSSNFIN
jgi:hypothetical protein